MRVFCFLLCFFLPVLVWGQPGIDNTLKAFSNCNVKEISKSFNKTIDLTLDGQQTSYSKQQAIFVLEKYFEENACDSLVVNQKGIASDGDAVYIIGTILTRIKKELSAFLFFKRKSESWILQEIRVE